MTLVESRSDWLRVRSVRGLGSAELKALIAEEMRQARVLRLTGARPARAALDFWREAGEALGRNVDLLEDSVTGELTVAEGQWMDVRFEPDRGDSFRHHNVGQPLHTDGAYVADAAARDVTLFYLERPADAGGESLFVDAETIAASAGAHDPQLRDRLFGLPLKFGKGAGAARVTPVLRREQGRLKVNWNYYRVLPDQGDAAAALREAFRVFLEAMIARGELASFKLQAGDAVFFLDEEVLHGRKAFEAARSGDRLLWKTYFIRDAA